MLDYETYCKIRDHFDRQALTITQTARALGLHPQTVSKWVRIEQYRPRRSTPRKTQLDPYKALIVLADDADVGRGDRPATKRKHGLHGQGR